MFSDGLDGPAGPPGENGAPGKDGIQHKSKHNMFDTQNDIVKNNCIIL